MKTCQNIMSRLLSAPYFDNVVRILMIALFGTLFVKWPEFADFGMIVMSIMIVAIGPFVISVETAPWRYKIKCKVRGVEPSITFHRF